VVLVLGDAHADDRNNLAALFSAYGAADEPVALQTGDLGYDDLPVPTWFVAGNDDDLDAIAALRRNDRPTRAVRNTTLLANTTARVEGFTVAGLSGNYAPTQYDRSRAELTGDRRRHFTREDVDRLRQSGDDVDVLLTQEAPHGLLSFGYDPGSEPIDELLATLEPSLCLVGHFHRHTEATLGGTRAVSLAPPGTRTTDWTPKG